MYLPGTIGDLIGDLRKNIDLNQKELAEKAGISESKLSRIESGETKNINCDTIIKIAKVLNVSTDYLLGLTTIREPKQIDVQALGLSEKAAAKMLSRTFKTEILNRLIEHNRFTSLITLIDVYFSGTATEGVAAKNELFNLTLSMLDDYKKGHPEKTAEVFDDKVLINAQKSAKGEAELEQIRNIFIGILRDIRKDIKDGKPTSPAIAQEMWQKILDGVPRSESGEIIKPTPDEMATLVANVVGQAGALDKGGKEMLQQVLLQMMENIGKSENDG